MKPKNIDIIFLELGWDNASLYKKSKYFAELAFSSKKESKIFPLLCAYSLELLAKSYLSKKSPLLLLEKNKSLEYFKQSLIDGTIKESPKSINILELIVLLKKMSPKIDYDNFFKIFFDKRNTEIHCGADSYKGYENKDWLPNYLETAQILLKGMNKTLKGFLAPSDYKLASRIILKDKKDIKAVLDKRKKDCKKYLETKKENQDFNIKDFENKYLRKIYKVIKCKCCGKDSILFGEVLKITKTGFDEEYVYFDEEILPKNFKCYNCNYYLKNLKELRVEKLDNIYTEEKFDTPEDYFDLYDKLRDEIIENYQNEQASEEDAAYEFYN
jgi:hypothetical protein